MNGNKWIREQKNNRKKSNKLRASCFSKKINKIDKPLARITKKKRGGSNKWNCKWKIDITNDTTETQRILIITMIK